MQRAEQKDIKDVRWPETSPRDFKRSGLRERQVISSRSAVDSTCQTDEIPDGVPFAADPPQLESSDAQEASAGFAIGTEGTGGYDRLEELEDEDFARQTSGGGVTKGRCSVKMSQWHDRWMHSVECGELDIYTCLGLSNVLTLTHDTRKIIIKLSGVLVLQIIVPCILLNVTLESGFRYEPLIPDIGFRTMGVSLYLYSLYSMYNNALDECRSSLLQFSIDQHVPMGYWMPMLVGEIINVFVSLILVFTLFVIFVDVTHPADLILNAVAVNFLGAVDGEMVDDVMQQEALDNFKLVFYQYGADEDEGRPPEHRESLNIVLNVLLTVIVVAGLFLSAVFFFAPSPDHMVTAKIGGKGYPKLI